MKDNKFKLNFQFINFYKNDYFNSFSSLSSSPKSTVSSTTYFKIPKIPSNSSIFSLFVCKLGNWQTSVLVTDF